MGRIGHRSGRGSALNPNGLEAGRHHYAVEQAFQLRVAIDRTVVHGDFAVQGHQFPGAIDP